MKFFSKFFFAAAMVFMICGIPAFAEDQSSDYVIDPNEEWYAVRTEAFARFDEDGKGYFEAKDWPGRRRAFRLMDVNSDGRITLEEFQSLRNRWLNRTFENLDLDGNRAIVRDEWMDIPADFDRLDRNKNEMIERHEFYKQ